MADSLSPECSPLKHSYDACFNAWFEGYLQPSVALFSSPSSSSSSTPNTANSRERAAYAKRKADEFDSKCGEVWESYRDCVQKAVKEKGLDTLLQQAREENPRAEPPPPAPHNPSAPS